MYSKIHKTEYSVLKEIKKQLAKYEKNFHKL